jgi:uncharacterized protein (TIGR02001 family)
MKKLVLISIALAAWPWEIAAGEVSGRITLASEYIFRGQAQSDGNPALQAGIDFAHRSGLFLGAWASTLDLESPSGRRDAELNYYLGWHFSAESRLSGALSLTRYTYPGQTTAFSYDYTEALITASWDDRYSLEFGYARDVYGFPVDARHIELRVDWPLRNAWVVSGGLGFNDLDELGSSRYAYGDIGVSARYSRLTFDLRWYNNERPAGFIGQLSAGSRLVGAVSLGF